MNAMHESCQNLQPLRIPGGWTVAFNKFEKTDPEELSEQDEKWLYSFNEDILYMYSDVSRKQNKQTENQRLGIDLGWYPDGEPNGSFKLLAILNENWEKPLLEFSSRSKEEIVRTLEKWLFVDFMPRYFIDEDVFRKTHQASKSVTITDNTQSEGG